MEETIPGLDTSLHLDMLRRSKTQRSLLARLVAAVKKELFLPDVYGIEWGDPDVVEPLRFVRDRYVLPYVRPEHTALEIGPGGGRWSRYLLGCGKLYVVDLHQELLDELRRRVHASHVVYVRNSGTDFPGVPAGSIDFVFSFGCFVHLDPQIVEAYLRNLRGVLKPGGNAVIQYADQTKIMAQVNPGFAQNTPERMRAMLADTGYRIVEEDTTTLWHSSLARFTH